METATKFMEAVANGFNDPIRLAHLIDSFAQQREGEAERNVERACSWAANCSLALHTLKMKVRDFQHGVVNKPPGNNSEQPRVVGYADRYNELLEESAKPQPQPAAQKSLGKDSAAIEGEHGPGV